MPARLADVLWQPPLPFPLSSTEPVLPNEERRMKIRGRVTQGSLSDSATAGLICETRFGVFKTARRSREQ